MRRAVRILARMVFVTGVLILIAAAAAPFVSADRFGEPVSRALAAALDRRVEISGPVRFQLFGGPGLSISDVIIHDDPRMGVEPFAYVDSLEVGIRLSALWRGAIEFSHLRLVQPSVNLVKLPHGDWDYLPLLERVVGDAHPGNARFPQIQVRGGRLNFKYGDTKSVFYFSNADVDAWPSEDDPDTVLLSFEGEPARTDQPAQGFGELSGGGRLVFSSEGENLLDLNLRLMRSAIPDVLTLLAGNGLGLGGFIASSARLKGPMSGIEIDGELEMAEFDRRFLLPGGSGNPRISYRGRLSLPKQELLLETAPLGEEPLPVSVRIRAKEYLVQPKWAIAVALRQLPLEDLLPLAREMGLELPEGVAGRGVLAGAFSWSPSDGVLGQLAVDDGAVLVDGEKSLLFDQARFLLHQDGVEMPPVEVELKAGQRAQVWSNYDTGQAGVDVAIETDGLPVDELNNLWARLTQAEAPPLLRECRGGTMAGRLACSRETWSGQLHLRDTELPVDGVAGPLRVQSANLEWNRGQFSLTELEGLLAELPLSGAYRFRPREERPHRFQIELNEVEAAQLEAALRPTLDQGRQGFIARTLRLRPTPPPDWLRQRRAAGKFTIGKLAAGPLLLEDVRSDLYWDGVQIRLANFRATGSGARIDGRLSIDLGSVTPAYDAHAAVKGLPWEGGLLDADGNLKTSGTGLSMLANATAEGSFHGRALRSASGVWDALSGCYEMSMSRGVPRLRLPSIEMTRGEETYHGWGRTTLGQRLEMDLFAGARGFRGTATLSPFEIELSPLDQVR